VYNIKYASLLQRTDTNARKLDLIAAMASTADVTQPRPQRNSWLRYNRPWTHRHDTGNTRNEHGNSNENGGGNGNKSGNGNDNGDFSGDFATPWAPRRSVMMPANANENGIGNGGDSGNVNLDNSAPIERVEHSRSGDAHATTSAAAAAAFAATAAAAGVDGDGGDGGGGGGVGDGSDDGGDNILVDDDVKTPAAEGAALSTPTGVEAFDVSAEGECFHNVCIFRLFAIAFDLVSLTTDVG
jgi:hypothetical protein